MLPMAKSQVMQATGYIHCDVGQLILLVPKGVFHHATPLHTSNGMFHMHTDTRYLAIGLLLIPGKLPAPWLFFSPGTSS
jgi:hypothetical protein